MYEDYNFNEKDRRERGSWLEHLDLIILTIGLGILISIIFYKIFKFTF